MKPDHAENLRLLEALLFATSEPLPISAIELRFEPGTDIRALLRDLRAQYEDRGIELFEAAGCWAFRTAPDLGDKLKLEKEVQKKLSRAAMETLAIIAYHQPLTRAEIENIRGVATNKGTLDLLMEAGWVKPGRRREAPGRPLTWVTTTEFLDHFGLETLADLPGVDELKASGLLDKRAAVETVSMMSDLFEDDGEHDIEDEESRDDALFHEAQDDDERQLMEENQ